MNKWTFTEHAKERLTERYQISEEKDIKSICKMLENKNIRLVKNYDNDRQIVNIDFKGDIQLVVLLKTKHVISCIPSTFINDESVKKLKKQLNKFMEEEINIASHIAKEVNSRMKLREKKIDFIIYWIYNKINNRETNIPSWLTGE